MATHTKRTIPDVHYIRRSSDYPSYVLVDRGERNLAIVVTTRPDPDFVEVLVDAYTVCPDTDPRYPGERVECFIVRDDGWDLDGDFETHCYELAEELRVLQAQCAEEVAS